jgi:hypothetical protein
MFDAPATRTARNNTCPAPVTDVDADCDHPDGSTAVTAHVLTRTVVPLTDNRIRCCAVDNGTANVPIVVGVPDTS